MTTTLNKIKEHNPSKGGWKNLLKYLNKTEADDEELSIETIVKSNGLSDAIWCLRAVDGYKKEIQLFAIFCARQVQHLMEDKRSIKALDVAEDYVNGKATKEELKKATGAAYNAASTAYDAASAAYDAADARAYAASAADAYDATTYAAAAAAATSAAATYARARAAAAAAYARAAGAAYAAGYAAADATTYAASAADAATYAATTYADAAPYTTMRKIQTKELIRICKKIT
tara:strand:- start:612 stop:1307 length:696 start_codon:yes stop_codon:yes gene_type:complete